MLPDCSKKICQPNFLEIISKTKKWDYKRMPKGLNRTMRYKIGELN